jgi:hypothetical protein
MLAIYRQWACDKRRKYIQEAEAARLATGLRPCNRSIFQWMKKGRKRKDPSVLNRER